MKYIKYFRESFTDLIDYKNEELEFFKDVEDILLPIEDEDFSVQINKNENPDDDDDIMEAEGELVRIYVERVVNDLETKPYIPTDLFVECFEHLVSLSKERGYTCSMDIVGENGQGPKYNYSNSSIAYSEFGEGEMSVAELLDLKAPINYIRFIIYKPE